jgi:hypothetical protein
MSEGRSNIIAGEGASIEHLAGTSHPNHSDTYTPGMPGVYAAKRVSCVQHGSMGKGAWERREQGAEEEGRSMEEEGRGGGRRGGGGEEHGRVGRGGRGEEHGRGGNK